MNDIIKVETIHPKEGDVILLKFDLDKINIADTVKWFDQLTEHFPNNQVIGIPIGIEPSLEDRERLIDFLINYKH